MSQTNEACPHCENDTLRIQDADGDYIHGCTFRIARKARDVAESELLATPAATPPASVEDVKVCGENQFHDTTKMVPPAHTYTSTACLHGLHDRCRHNCKYCDAACHCTCHNIAVVEPPAQERLDTPKDPCWTCECPCHQEGRNRRCASCAARTTPRPTCKRCNGKRTIDKHDGGTHYETDSEAEFLDHWRTIPCPDCCTAPEAQEKKDA